MAEGVGDQVRNDLVHPSAVELRLGSSSVASTRSATPAACARGLRMRANCVPAMDDCRIPLPVRRFPIRLAARSRPLLLLWGVRESNAYVEINGELFARFGFFSVRTPMANVARWRIEGPWRWITAIGVRRSVRHGDFTFGGNHTGGVRLDFRRPVRIWRLAVPALYVTVADLDGFAAALSANGVEGEDARRR